MKRIYILSLLLCMTCSLYAGTHCYIPINRILSLSGAGRDKAESVLTCFSFEQRGESASGRKYLDYRVNYNLHKELYDYDIFTLWADGTIQLSTDNYQSYLSYKKSFKDYGFKLTNETTDKSNYKYGKYELSVWDTRNADGNVAYVFLITM